MTAFQYDNHCQLQRLLCSTHNIVCGWCFSCCPLVTPVLHFQLHTSELNDGYDWGRLNLQSVTEQSSMDDFLATAELAGTEFVAGENYLT